MATGPLLSWAKADVPAFLKKARVPGILALVLFVFLFGYFVAYLKPSYDAMIAAGGSQAVTLLETGPPIYHYALTLAGFLVASVLFFNSLFMLGRIIRAQARAKKLNPLVAFFVALRERASQVGGFLAHLSMAVILVGLIGSSMYVTEASGYLAGDIEGGDAPKEFVIQDYRLTYQTDTRDEQENGNDTIYTVTLNVYKGDRFVGQVSPGIHLANMTQQRMAIAAVMTLPLQDLFVVYNGVNDDEAFSLTAFVNPFILFVWVGFALLMAGTIIATLGRRRKAAQKGSSEVEEPTPRGEQ
jgi:cytochrome c-type biogenesis protein CcmF